MDFLEVGFRAKYESVCVGNLAAEDEGVFFEGLLCEEGLGEFFLFGFLGVLIVLVFFFTFFVLFFLFPFQSVGQDSADQTMGFGF